MSYSNSLEKVRLDIDGPIATVSLERPNKLNALYPETVFSPSGRHRTGATEQQHSRDGPTRRGSRILRRR